MNQLKLSTFSSLIFFTLLCNLPASGQVLNGDLTFNTQAQVNAFCGCFTVINGKLIISGNSINNLTPLNSITEVVNTTDIENTSLTSLTGLENITTLGKTTTIKNNDLLTDLSGLDNLNLVSNGLVIIGNSTLTSLNGLGNLSSVGRLELANSNLLADLSVLSSLTSISGNLIIRNVDGLQHIDGLSSLNTIGDQIIIRNNAQLENIDGLSNVNSLGKHLYIHENPMLNNIDGLSGLTNVPKKLFIYDNPALENLDGLSNITSVGNDFEITGNTMLADCCGIHELLDNNGIGGPINIANNDTGCDSQVEINTYCEDADTDGYNLHEGDCNDGDSSINPSATEVCDGVDNDCDGMIDEGFEIFVGDITLSTQADVNAFSSCIEIIQGKLTIDGATINDLTPLNNLKEVTGLFKIQNTGLTDFIGIENLTTLGHAVRVEDNPSLINFTGLSGLTSISGGFVIKNNDSMTSFDGITSLNSTGRLEVSENLLLANIDGLSSLTAINGDVYFRANAGLLNIDGLSNVITIGDQIYFSRNKALLNIDGLSNIGDPLFIIQILENDALTNIDGVANIPSTTSYVLIEGNPVLANLDGLGSLTTVGHYLDINSNPLLNNIDGLQNLQSVGLNTTPPIIGTHFVLVNNGSFTNLDPLSNLTTIVGDLAIIGHSNLTDCCGIYDLLNNGGIGGFIQISNNDTGCDSQGQINTYCQDADMDNYNLQDGDCNDNNGAINPGATEVCNGIDDNCDGMIDEGFDVDGDGFTTCQNDCNDNDGSIFPGATEVCDGVDNNCDGQIDEGEVCCPSAHIIYVDANASGANNGKSWTDAFIHLQDALELAPTCSAVTEIWVADGTYYPDEGLGVTKNDRVESFVLIDGISLYGGFAGGETSLLDRDWVANQAILSGDIDKDNLLDNDNSFQVVQAHGIGNSTTIDGFIISYGRTANTCCNNTGGGIDIRTNTALTVSNCTIKENRGRHGGGIFIGNGSSPTFLNCFVIANHGRFGGGVKIDESNPSFINCAFSGNFSENGGGGIENNFQSNTNIINCSFSGNLADGNGGGIYNLNGAFISATNSILWGNNSQIYSTIANKSAVDYSIIEGGHAGTGNIDADPLFVNQPPIGLGTGGDLRIQDCSPALDAGDDLVNTEPDDLDGNPRKHDAIAGGILIDMGAFEYQGSYSLPNANCQNQTVQLDAGGTGMLPTSSLDNGSTGCAPLTFTVGGEMNLNYSCTDIGNHPVTLTVTDNNGYTSTCNATVTVEDKVDPNIICPTNVTKECDQSTSSQWTGTATATDNCTAAANISISENDNITLGACTNEWTVTRTWTATDGYSNSASCVQTITVTDTKAPAITCPASVTSECDDNKSPAELGTATAFDNCDTQPVISSIDASSAGSCAKEWTITRTWTATDACGNSSSCDQVITVEDSTPPAITCPNDITVECDADNSSTSTGMATATDNCSTAGDITISESDAMAAGGCANATVITRTWTATDECGQSSSCDQTVTVEDSQGPSITCPANVTVECDGDHSSTVNGTATATDNCSVAGKITIGESDAVTPGNCANALTITRTWTATDECGNPSSCDQVIDVVDTTAPSMICGSLSVTPNADGTYTLSQTEVDGLGAGSTDNCGMVSFSASPNTFNCADEGQNNVTITGTDPCGNSSNCTATVTVAPYLVINSCTESPETCDGAGDGTISITATALGGQVKYSIDGGSNFQASGIFTNLSPGTYSIVVKVFGIAEICEKTDTKTVAAGNPAITWHKDSDGDGYSDGNTQVACSQPAGYISNPLTGTDCNDNDSAINPGASELCDGIDNDCDGNLMAGEVDNDGDGYMVCEGDCNDTNAAVNPGATEICNGIDDDCDGEVDEGTNGGQTWTGSVTFVSQADVDAWLACYSAIDGNLTIAGYDITSLSNLINIVEVTGTVSIYYNGSLASLDGLDNLATVGGGLSIFYNFLLSDCCAIHTLINGGVTGTITIFFNAAGCNSTSEINAECGTALISGPNADMVIGDALEMKAEEETMDIVLFPNPVNSVINLNTKGYAGIQATVTVIDNMGRTVLTEMFNELNSHQNSIDVTGLQNGIYNLALKPQGRKPLYRRFVKVE